MGQWYARISGGHSRMSTGVVSVTWARRLSVRSALSHKSDPRGEIPPRRDAKDLVPRLWPYPSPIKF